MNQMLELADMDFEAAIIKIYKNVKENDYSLSEKMKNLSKGIETIRDRNSRSQKYSIWKEKSTCNTEDNALIFSQENFYQFVKIKWL